FAQSMDPLWCETSMPGTPEGAAAMSARPGASGVSRACWAMAGVSEGDAAAAGANSVPAATSTELRKRLSVVERGRRGMLRIAVISFPTGRGTGWAGPAVRAGTGEDLGNGTRFRGHASVLSIEPHRGPGGQWAAGLKTLAPPGPQDPPGLRRYGGPPARGPRARRAWSAPEDGGKRRGAAAAVTRGRGVEIIAGERREARSTPHPPLSRRRSEVSSSSGPLQEGPLSRTGAGAATSGSAAPVLRPPLSGPPVPRRRSRVPTGRSDGRWGGSPPGRPPAPPAAPPVRRRSADRPRSAGLRR